VLGPALGRGRRVACLLPSRAWNPISPSLQRLSPT
jgi:hypothetical protein